MRFRILNESIDEVDSDGHPLSQDQIRFFKDSKIRDSRGNLLVCYHGTSAKFDKFKKGDIGFHFGTKSQAEYRNNYKYDNGMVSDKSNLSVNAYYLNIVNPFEYADIMDWDSLNMISTLMYGLNYWDSGESVEDMKYDLPDEFNSDKDIEQLKNILSISKSNSGYADIGNKQLRDFFMSHGYDGIKYMNEWEGYDYSYIVFEPNQIKSITNKNPSSSSNINESKETQFLSDEQIKQFLSEIGNICWYSKSMCMDEACVYLESEFSINALWKANSIYIGDKRLLSIEFSHEGKNCWAVYQVHFYDNKKTYGVGDW